MPCYGWIDTKYVLYKDGIVALIVGQSQQSTTQWQWQWQWQYLIQP